MDETIKSLERQLEIHRRNLSKLEVLPTAQKYGILLIDANKPDKYDGIAILHRILVLGDSCGFRQAWEVIGENAASWIQGTAFLIGGRGHG